MKPGLVFLLSAAKGGDESGVAGVKEGVIPLGIPKETIEYFRVLSDLRFAFYKKARRILVKSAFFFGHDARIIRSSCLDFSRIHSGYCLV